MGSSGGSTKHSDSIKLLNSLRDLIFSIRCAAQDAHTDGNGAIHVDTVNNCFKPSFYRDGSDGILSFLRPFQTCDNDYVIEDGTTHIVFGYGSGPLYR